MRRQINYNMFLKQQQQQQYQHVDVGGRGGVVTNDDICI